ncbi:molybdenum cofactor guanylyltransferase MobA [Chitinimonas sp.]|uniref:molybdenum cofactor guanylyltransferase MobA n=1 Tax=Chitinimonas sp. TaxID=1934313 RepID=UPI0035B142A1
MTEALPRYEAVILAGGQGRRMDGRDKGLVSWQGLPLVEHALARLRAQTRPPARILISANRHQDRYAAFGCTVVADLRSGFHGPLAGMEAALATCNADWLLCIPCDMPQLPTELAEWLFQPVVLGAAASLAHSADGQQPVCCLLQRAQLASLSAFLDAGRRRVSAWLDQIGAAAVHFPAQAGFANFNSLAALGSENPHD